MEDSQVRHPRRHPSIGGRGRADSWRARSRSSSGALPNSINGSTEHLRWREPGKLADGLQRLAVADARRWRRPQGEQPAARVHLRPRAFAERLQLREPDRG